MQFRVAGNLAESPAEDFRAKAAAAHPEQYDVLEALLVCIEAAYARAEGDEFVHRLGQLVGHGHPAELVFDDLLMSLILLPQRRVFAEDFARPLFALGAADDRLDVGLVLAQAGLHSVE